MSAVQHWPWAFLTRLHGLKNAQAVAAQTLCNGILQRLCAFSFPDHCPGRQSDSRNSRMRTSGGKSSNVLIFQNDQIDKTYVCLAGTQPIGISEIFAKQSQCC